MPPAAPSTLPYLLSAERLADCIKDHPGGQPGLRIVCLGDYQQYLAGHIPGALYLDPKRLNAGGKPAPGLLPDLPHLRQAMQETGLDENTHVVCYDDQAGTAAARMMWVLEALGHRSQSFLDGGLQGWQSQGLPLENGAQHVTASDWQPGLDPSVIVHSEQILKLLENSEIENGAVRILDARSSEEHQGLKSKSDRPGRIPGAVNLNWLDTIEENRHLKPAETLLGMLENIGITPDSDVIVHCQTHQRSSHAFMMLRALGFKNIRGYAGSWSDWSSRTDLPVETGPPRSPGT